MFNLIQTVENMRIAKSLSKGLLSYTQANCQVTLTDRGYRIYRPPNKSQSADGNTMWGGLKIQPYAIENKDVLIQGHTYIVMFHVEGISDNAPSSIGWSNNMGWSGGGLNPAPSNVSYLYTPANFNGQMDCYYKFTCNDSIWKTCTSSYSSFVAGTSYQSYKDFMYGFGYVTSTGTHGTDVYITNIRMYDITNNLTNVDITKNGIITGVMNENKDYTKASIGKYDEIYSKEFYEL